MNQLPTGAGFLPSTICMNIFVLFSCFCFDLKICIVICLFIVHQVGSCISPNRVSPRRTPKYLALLVPMPLIGPSCSAMQVSVLQCFKGSCRRNSGSKNTAYNYINIYVYTSIFIFMFVSMSISADPGRRKGEHVWEKEFFFGGVSNVAFGSFSAQ